MVRALSMTEKIEAEDDDIHSHTSLILAPNARTWCRTVRPFRAVLVGTYIFDFAIKTVTLSSNDSGSDDYKDDGGAYGYFGRSGDSATISDLHGSHGGGGTSERQALEEAEMTQPLARFSQYKALASEAALLRQPLPEAEEDNASHKSRVDQCKDAATYACLNLGAQNLDDVWELLDNLIEVLRSKPSLERRKLLNALRVATAEARDGEPYGMHTQQNGSSQTFPNSASNGTTHSDKDPARSITLAKSGSSRNLLRPHLRKKRIETQAIEQSVVQKESDGIENTLVRATMPTNVPQGKEVDGLEDILDQTMLLTKVQQAKTWCKQAGVSNLSEVAAQFDAFAVNLELKPLEQNRLRKLFQEIPPAEAPQPPVSSTKSSAQATKFRATDVAGVQRRTSEMSLASASGSKLVDEAAASIVTDNGETKGAGYGSGSLDAKDRNARQTIEFDRMLTEFEHDDAGEEACADTEGYADQNGLSCADWAANLPCETIDVRFGEFYDAMQQVDILSNCPQSCRVCTASPTPSPLNLLTQDFTQADSDENNLVDIEEALEAGLTEQIFHVLDVDESGSLDEDEFVPPSAHVPSTMPPTAASPTAQPPALLTTAPTTFSPMDRDELKFAVDASVWDKHRYPLINTWDTSKVTNMDRIFQAGTDSNTMLVSRFNEAIDSWNTAQVTSMRSMFAGSVDWFGNAAYPTKFNQPLNSWNTAQVTTMWGMFTTAKYFNQPLDKWNTGQVTKMRDMFYKASEFNQPLEKWNTSHVTDMGWMFRDAKSFNQPLDTWNTPHVTDMGYMLYGASYFNQPLNNWNIARVTNFRSMLIQADSFKYTVPNDRECSVPEPVPFGYVFTACNTSGGGIRAQHCMARCDAGAGGVAGFQSTIHTDGTAVVNCLVSNVFDLDGCEQCPTGKHAKRGKCVDCPAGTFSPAGSCLRCAAGQFSNSSGSATCTSCIGGKVPNDNQTACETCGTGKRRSAGGSVCTQCDAGSVAEAGSIQCKQCIRGTVPDDAKEHCTKCLAGKYSDIGSTVCEKCTRGQYSNAGAPACMDCDQGRYPNVNNSACLECRPGKTSSKGDIYCSDCEAGWVAQAGSIQCKPCTSGTVPDYAKEHCTECPAGKYSEVGNTVCEKCTRGQYSNAGAPACTDCDKGRIPNVNNNACVDCTPGKTSSKGDIYCTPCGVGEVAAAGSSECNPCVGGTSPDKEKEVCNTCPVGKFSQEASSVCEPCAGGRYSKSIGSTHCTDCQSGRSPSVNRSECIPCEKGRFNANESMCTSCGAGHYSSEKGQTSCRPCEPGWYASYRGVSQCKQCLGTRTITMSRVMVDGHQQWIHIDGAENKSRCGCVKQTRVNAAGHCVDCEEGVDCFGMGEFLVKYGYAAEAMDNGELSVFKCHGLAFRCKGGMPGETCAGGREGVSCAQCMRMRTPSSDGTCVECGRRDTLPLVFACLLASVLLVFMYRLVHTSDRAKQNPWVSLCGMSCSIMITAMQQLGLIRMISINWPVRLANILDLFRNLVIDVQLLRLNCVASSSSLGLFLAKLSIISAGIIGIVLIHVTFVGILHHGRFREHQPSLVCGLGLFTMVFYISVAGTVLEPMQCLSNPNGKQTVSGYQDVVCWQTDEHRKMVSSGFAALLVPLLYLVHCAVMVSRFPQKMIQGDTRFLRMYMYLFFRYRAQMYWYAPVHMFRNLLFSITPVIPNPVGQLITMQILTLAHLISSIYFAPWRLQHANILEAFVTTLILVILSVTCLLVDEVPISEIVSLGIALICTITIAVLFMILYALFVFFSKRHKKTFDFFLCHHKAGACCLVRLLRMHFHDMNCTAFLDSDNLSDLDRLFDYVANDTQNLVVVCSKEILMRPWCVGEIVTGMLHRVKAVKVIFTEFVEPSAEFMHEYDARVDISVLSSRGIDLAMIQQGMRWLLSCQALELPSCATKHTMDSLVSKITSICFNGKDVPGQVSSKQDEFPSGVHVLLLIDHSNFEITACALILVKLLFPYVVTQTELTPHILPREKTLPETTEILIILCSNGAFRQSYLLQSLWTAAERLQGCYQIPVLAEDNFRFPTTQSLEDYRSAIASVSDDEETMFSLILDVFKTIALSFQPERTEEMLLTQAAAVAKRLLNHRIEMRMVKTTTSMVKTITSRHPSMLKHSSSSSSNMSIHSVRASSRISL